LPQSASDEIRPEDAGGWDTGQVPNGIPERCSTFHREVAGGVAADPKPVDLRQIDFDDRGDQLPMAEEIEKRVQGWMRPIVAFTGSKAPVA